MRLKSDIWVAAYLRICAAHGIPGVLARRGDPDAGAIYIRVSRLDGHCDLYGPAFAGLDGTDAERRFSPCLKTTTVAEADADAYLARQAKYDSDLWIVETEDRLGRHCLADWLSLP
jgi:hypothetical protein